MGLFNGPKLRDIAVVLVPLILVSSVAACAIGTASDSYVKSGPETTVRQFLQACESGDSEKAMSYWTRRTDVDFEDFRESIKEMSSLDLYNENFRVVSQNEEEEKAVVELDCDGRVIIGDETEVMHIVVDYELVILNGKWLINNSVILEPE